MSLHIETHVTHPIFFAYLRRYTHAPGCPARGKRNKLLVVEYATAIPRPRAPSCAKLQGLLKPVQLPYAGSAEVTAVATVRGLDQGSRRPRVPHANRCLDLLERYRFLPSALPRVAEFEEAVEHAVVAGGDEAHTASCLSHVVY